MSKTKRRNKDFSDNDKFERRKLKAFKNKKKKLKEMR